MVTERRQSWQESPNCLFQSIALISLESNFQSWNNFHAYLWLNVVRLKKGILYIAKEPCSKSATAWHDQPSFGILCKVSAQRKRSCSALANTRLSTQSGGTCRTCSQHAALIEARTTWLDHCAEIHSNAKGENGNRWIDEVWGDDEPVKSHWGVQSCLVCRQARAPDSQVQVIPCPDWPWWSTEPGSLEMLGFRRIPVFGILWPLLFGCSKPKAPSSLTHIPGISRAHLASLIEALDASHGMSDHYGLEHEVTLTMLILHKCQICVYTFI